MTKKKQFDPVYTEMRKEYPRTWRIWYRMNKRCQIGQNGDYVDVEVCDDWDIRNGSEDAFLQFLDDMGPCEDYKEIDRINPLGDYEQGNCRWVDPAVNRRNTRARYNGDYKMVELAKSNGICGPTYYSRLRMDWHPEDAATLPPSQVKYKKRIV